MNERLVSLGVPLPFAGSLSVAPQGFVVQLGAQLSYTLNTTGIPAFFEEELMMLNAGANVFRSVSIGTVGSPIVVLKSLSMSGQTVTVTCVKEKSSPTIRTISLDAGKMRLVPACTDYRFEENQPWHNALAIATRSKPEVAGISIESNAAPESLAVYGITPLSHNLYQALTFTQVSTLKSPNSVYNGAPVGPTAALSFSAFAPELAVANFMGAAAQVTVSYRSKVLDSSIPKVVAQVRVPPFSSMTVPIRSLAGDRNMENSFIISTDGLNGQIISTLRSVSQDGQFAEILLNKPESWAVRYAQWIRERVSF